jgi:hypothetical protein
VINSGQAAKVERGDKQRTVRELWGGKWRIYQSGQEHQCGMHACVTPGQWVGVINSGHMDKAANAYRGDKNGHTGDKQLKHKGVIISGHMALNREPVSNEDACLQAHHCGHMGGSDNSNIWVISSKRTPG